MLAKATDEQKDSLKKYMKKINILNLLKNMQKKRE